MFARAAWCAAALALGGVLPGGQAAALEVRPPMRVELTTWAPASAAHAIAQTPDGYLWWGTASGLFRFDGERLVALNERTQPALPARRVQRLLVTRGGTLWVGMWDDGLHRLEGARFVRVPRAHGLADDRIRSLMEDANGDLWVGTRAGLSRSRGERWTSYGRAQGLRDDEIFQIFRHRDGTLRVETRDGYSRLQGERFVSEPLPPPGGLDRAQRLWPDLLPARHPDPDDPLFRGVPRIVFEVMEDADGHTWFATREGLYQVTATGLRRFGVEDGLVGNGVSDLFEDREGNVWATTMGGGITRLSAPRTTALGPRQGLGGDVPLALAEGPDGVIWVSTNHGVSRYQGGKVTNLKPFVDHLPNHTFGAVTVAPDGALWLAPFEGAPYRNVGVEFQPVAADPVAPGRPSALVAAAGALWLGTDLGAVARLEGPEVAVVQTPELRCPKPPCPGAVVALLPRRAGGLWIVTARAGLWALAEAGPERRLAAPEGEVRGALEDAAGALWLATTRGLVLSRGQERITFDVGHGLPEDDVLAVLEDGLGDRWLAFARGLFRVPAAELEAVARGQLARLNPIAFNRQDGDGQEVVFGERAFGLRAGDGRLWFGTARDVFVVEAPERWRPLPPVAPVIEQLLVDGRPHPGDDRVFLVPPGAGILEIAFTAPAQRDRAHVEIRHRLVGFEDAWTTAGPQRRVRYTNLPPGSYAFELTATRSGEREASVVRTSLRMRLSPRFHQTWPFYLLVASALVGASALAQRWRVRRVQARFAAILAERNRIARDLHDALAQVFSAIGFQLDRLAGSLASSQREAQDHVRHARHMLAHGKIAAREVVSNLRHGSDRPPRPSLPDRLEELARHYAGVEFIVSVQGPPLALPADQEDDLGRIAEEAVSNAVAHGGARHISIELHHEAEHLALWVRDDGRGFVPPGDDSQPPGGFGLVGMRERAARLGARLEIASEPGVGTEVGVVLPRAGAKERST